MELTNPGGRPKKYASEAERQRAFRERYATINVRTLPETKDTIRKIVEFTDTSEAEVVNSLIKFALTNRTTWLTQGLWGKRLPHAGVDDMPSKTTKENPRKTDRQKTMEFVKHFGLKVAPKPGTSPLIGAPWGEWFKVFDTWREAAEFFDAARWAHHDHGTPYPWGQAPNPAPRKKTPALAPGDVVRFDGASPDGKVNGSMDVVIVDPHVNRADVGKTIDGREYGRDGKRHLGIALVERDRKGEKKQFRAYHRQLQRATNPAPRKTLRKPSSTRQASIKHPSSKRPELPYIIAALHGDDWRVIGHAATLDAAKAMGTGYANLHHVRVAVHDHLSPYHVGRTSKTAR
jgi:hypothetical protein